MGGNVDVEAVLEEVGLVAAFDWALEGLLVAVDLLVIVQSVDRFKSLVASAADESIYLLLQKQLMVIRYVILKRQESQLLNS